MKPPATLLDFLARHGVVYRLIHHPVVYTAQELAAVLGIKGRQFAKVAFVTNGADAELLVLPGDHRIDFARLPGWHLAPETAMRAAFPDCEPGTMPPLGALYHVPMRVDRRLAENERIAFQAGTHSDVLTMAWADYQRVAQPVLADFAFKPV